MQSPRPGKVREFAEIFAAGMPASDQVRLLHAALKLPGLGGRSDCFLQGGTISRS